MCIKSKEMGEVQRLSFSSGRNSTDSHSLVHRSYFASHTHTCQTARHSSSIAGKMTESDQSWPGEEMTTLRLWNMSMKPQPCFQHRGKSLVISRYCVGMHLRN